MQNRPKKTKRRQKRSKNSMKAEYKAGRPQDDLTVGKKYDVTDVKCKKGFEVSEIYIKNDKAEERWYSIEHFIMYAEATQAMKMAAVEGALAADAMATPEAQTIVTNITAANQCGDVAKMVEKAMKKHRAAHGLGLMFGA